MSYEPISFSCGYRNLVILPAMDVMATTAVDQAREQYRREFEVYRQNDASFTVKKGQYDSSPTFAHEQELIEAARTMLLARAQLWWSYWQALKVEVAEVPGLDETVRGKLISQLDESQRFLDDNKSVVAVNASRSGLLTLAQEVNRQDSKNHVLAYSTLGLIHKARLYYALAQTLEFATQLEQRVEQQIRDEALRDARVRGIAETKMLLMQALERVGGEVITTEDYSTAYRPQRQFEKTVGNLNPSYDQLKQSFALLTELAKGIEW